MSPAVTSAADRDDLDEAVASVLRARERISYGLVFGSRARGDARADSDLDVAIGLAPGATLAVMELGTLIADLEAATGLRVDVVLLDEAPTALAYRVFRDGRPVLVRDREQMVARKAWAITEYLDFQPAEARCAEGVLKAAARGR